MENKIAGLLKKIKEKQKVSDKVSNKLYTSGSSQAILYGLWKIRKSIVNGVPSFDHILSTIGSPTYKLTKFYVPLLEPLT